MKDGAILVRASQTCSPIDVLLACASREISVDGEGRLRRTLEDLSDWDGVLAMADRHGLIPQLERCVRSLEPNIVPRNVLEELDRRQRSLAVTILQFGRRLFAVLDELEQASIRAITLKGPALSAQVYGDPLLRHPGDIDLLVGHRDVAHAVRLREAAGYRNTQTDLHPVTRRRIHQLGSEIELVAVSDATVDIHWALAPSQVAFQPDLNELLSRATRADLWGRSVPVLAPQDLLQYLCLHGTRHQWWRLILLCDLAALVRRYPDLDWQRVCRDAERWRGRRSVSLGLVLAHRLLGLSLPDHVVSWAGDPAVARLADVVERRLRAGDTGDLVNISMESFALRATDKRRDRIIGALRATRFAVRPQEPDFTSWRLPRWLYPLYYGWRPLRLTRRWVLRRWTEARASSACR